MPLRILHLIDSNGLYGAERMLLDLMQRQQSSGLSPILGSIGKKDGSVKELEAIALERGLTVQPIRMRSGLNLAGAINILEIAQKQNIDILHSHGYKTNILLGMLPACFRRIPLVCTLHGWTGTTPISKISLYNWAERQLLKYHDAVIAVSDQQLHDKRLRAAGIDNNKLFKISNGIDLDDEENAQAGKDEVIQSFVKSGKAIVSIGRLSREKSFETLIEAMSVLRNGDADIKLIIIGEGYLRDKLQKQIDTLHLNENIQLVGYRIAAKRYLHLFDALIISSVTEGLPITMLEAMAAGVPVVATAVGGIPEAIKDGITGLLAPPRNPVKLAEAISRVINDMQLAGTIRSQARLMIRKEYDSRVMADKYAELYARIAGRI